jgi:polar amino acid transport system substrate-binding protein
MKSFLGLCMGALLSAILFHTYYDPSQKGQAHASVYDRVMDTQTIRCGYIPRVPAFVLDPNTKEMSGIMYDITMEMGKRLNLKIEWVEETNFAELVVGIKNKRFDSVCSGVWSIAQRAREIDYTTPLFYETASVYVQATDTRFDKDKTLLNKSSTTFAVMDGAVSSYMSEAHFPAAKKIALPENSVYSQVMLELMNKKADATVFPDADAHAFQLQHPETVKRLDNVGALGAFGAVFPVARGQEEFRQMLSNTVNDMINQGAIDRILSKYPDYKGVIRPVTKQFE